MGVTGAIARQNLVRVGLAAAGAVCALALTEWPSPGAGAVLVAFAGAAIAFGFDHFRVHRELARIRRLRLELAAERSSHAHEQRLLRADATRARRDAAVAEVMVRVWADLFTESQRDSRNPIPSAVVFARRERELRARGLEEPPHGT